jgi:hypothetical protein
MVQKKLYLRNDELQVLLFYHIETSINLIGLRKLRFDIAIIKFKPHATLLNSIFLCVSKNTKQALTFLNYIW